MKKVFFCFALSIVLFASCSKYDAKPEIHEQPPIVGQWGLDTLITYFYDSAGLRRMEVTPYQGFAIDYSGYFQFGADYTWTEKFIVDSAIINPVANGTYEITSDSTFTLIYPNAVPGKINEPCKILSLNTTRFVFSKQLSTVFNGTTPGYIQYVYQLSKH